MEGNGICSAAFCESAALREKFFAEFQRARPLSHLALLDASSPKGRAKSTAGNFLIALKTSATSLRPWLSLWESWRGSA